MIADNDLNYQLPKSIHSIFKELNILQYLRKAGIMKAKGCSAGFLSTFIFNLVFEGRIFCQLLQTRKGQAKPRKDAIFRFYNDPKNNLRYFLISLSLRNNQYSTRPAILTFVATAYKDEFNGYPVRHRCRNRA